MKKNELKENGNEYVYGLDLSLTSSGVAIFDSKGNSVLIDSVPTDSKTDLGLRLWYIQHEMQRYKKLYPPKVVCMERCFTRFNTATQNIYRVHGIVNCEFWDCEQIYYAPTSIKKILLHGKAKKEEVQKKILENFNQLKFNNFDESDAFACGLVYFIKNDIINLNS